MAHTGSLLSPVHSRAKHGKLPGRYFFILACCGLWDPGRGDEGGRQGIFHSIHQAKPDLSWPVLRLELALETNFKEAFQRTARVFC